MRSSQWAHEMICYRAQSCLNMFTLRFAILGILVTIQCSGLRRGLGSIHWESIPEDTNLILLNFNDTRELIDEIGFLTSKFSLAVGTTDEISYVPPSYCSGPRASFTLVLFDVVSVTNAAETVKILQRCRSFRSLSALVILLHEEINLTSFGGALRIEHEENLNGTRTRTNLDLYLLTHNCSSQTENRKFARCDRVCNTILFEFYYIKSMLFFKPVEIKGNRVDYHVFVTKVARRRDFNGVEIVAVAQRDQTTEPEVSFTEDSTYWNAKFDSGMAVDIFRDLRDELNFTEKAMIGSYVGMVGNRVSGRSYELLANGTADLSISQVSSTAVRATVFSYLQPTQYSSGVLAIFIQPPLNSMRNIFVAPFSQGVWTMLVIQMILIILLMMALPHCLPIEKCDESTDGTFRTDAAMWAIGTACQKGWPRQPSASSMRIVFLIGSLAGLVTYQYYAASIVSVLSVEHIPVTSFTDLIRYNYRFHAHEHSSTMQAFLQDNIQRYNLNQGILTVRTDEEVSILESSRDALLSFGDIFYSAAQSMNISNAFLCKRISTVVANRNSPKSAMFVIRGSPLREYFDHKIIIMKQAGLNIRYVNIFSSLTTPRCLQEPMLEEHELDLADVYVAFVVLLVGKAISLGILGIEWKAHTELLKRHHIAQ